MTRWTAEGSVTIAASPMVVYELVSDVTGYGRWATEAVSGRWLDGATGPVVGARFRGSNRRSWHRWSTTCIVKAADPGRLFEFRVQKLIPTALWRYEITPTEGGCQVSERTARLYPLVICALGNLVFAGVADRDGLNQRNIASSLRQLKQYAEETAA